MYYLIKGCLDYNSDNYSSLYIVQNVCPISKTLLMLFLLTRKLCVCACVSVVYVGTCMLVYMSMCVCLYVCVYVHVGSCVAVYMCVPAYVCTCPCGCLHCCVHVHIILYACMSVYTSMCVCMARSWYQMSSSVIFHLGFLFINTHTRGGGAERWKEKMQWKSVDNLQEWIFSFNHVDSGNGIRVFMEQAL